MRKRGKVKIVLTIFIIVLFSCTAVIGNSRTGVIENVMAKNAADGLSETLYSDASGIGGQLFCQHSIMYCNAAGIRFVFF